jgi:hypothetical protein
MSSTTEPDSTAITRENIAPGQQIVSRVQGGGLRFLDAHEIQEQSFHVVTRPFQDDTTQHWKLTNVSGEIYTIVQVSSGRFLDSFRRRRPHRTIFLAVTRPQQNDDTQRWRIQDFGGSFVTIQQVSSGRFLTATFVEDFPVTLSPEVAGSNEHPDKIPVTLDDRQPTAVALAGT